MARNAEGWRIRKPPGRKTYLVRFRLGGDRFELSTGQSAPGAASKEAERIYADHVQRHGAQARKPVARHTGESPPLDETIALWLDTDSTLDPDTARVWECYGRRWLEHFGELHNVTDLTAADYRNERLRKVTVTTVRKELGALRRFARWAFERGYLPREVTVSGVPSRVTGTPHTQRRRVEASDLSPKQVEAFLAALPEWSTSRKVERFPIRARFRVQYETGLRPSTIDGLEVPTHWHPGSKVLRITPAIDKIRHDRVVPLTPKAVRALKSVAPKAGLVFGKHDYRDAVETAAKAALPRAVAATFTTAHLRSARATHLLEKTGNVAGVQHLLGHKDTRSTSRYLRPSFRAAEAVLKSIGGQSQNSGGSRRAKKPKKRRAKERT